MRGFARLIAGSDPFGSLAEHAPCRAAAPVPAHRARCLDPKHARAPDQVLLRVLAQVLAQASVCPSGHRACRLDLAHLPGRFLGTSRSHLFVQLRFPAEQAQALSRLLMADNAIKAVRFHRVCPARRQNLLTTETQICAAASLIRGRRIPMRQRRSRQADASRPDKRDCFSIAGPIAAVATGIAWSGIQALQ